jgi:hypothetical protein
MPVIGVLGFTFANKNFTVPLPAQVSASSNRSSVEPALSLKNELEAYDKDKDRRPLLNALKEQFLLNRLVAASQAENTRKLALQFLFNRMERMSDKMLLKTVRVLSEIGAQELTAVTGVPVSGGRTPMFSIQPPGGGSQGSLGDRSTSNLVKRTAILMEPYEQLAPLLRDKAPHHIEQKGRPPHSARASIPTAKTYLHDFDRLDVRSK